VSLPTNSPRNADLRPAVSVTSSVPGARQWPASVRYARLPTGSRRYSRLEVCATERGAFTIVELLALIFTTGLLASMMVTSLTATRADLAAVQCRNHLRQLTVAWDMYSSDNRGQLVFNTDGPQAGLKAGNEAWVVGSMIDFTGSDCTNIAMLIDHIRYPFGAYLGPYLHAAQVFKCPADKFLLRIAGVQVPRVRSVSMNNFVGRNSRTWQAHSKYLLCTNAAQIRFPAGMVIFLDESELSIGDGWFASNPDTPFQLIDYPAAYHNCGGSFSFADGHCEIRHWRDRRTIPLPGQLVPLAPTLTNDSDVLWLQQRAAGVPSFP
jgi:hypothetical protein